MTAAPTSATAGTTGSVADLDAWWRAANYLAAGQIYLLDNPLLTEPLLPQHIKPRLIGHWGSVPGITLTYAHLNRVIMHRRRRMLFVCGPGHGAAGLNAAAWLEGSYSERHPEVTEDAAGMRELFRQFAFPGGVPGCASPHLPGSIHEGGELGYSLAHATGAVLDDPDLVAACVIGDGEAETGTLATSWNAPLFLRQVHDGVVLPILHLNGYKAAGPALPARIPRRDLDGVLSGYGWDPIHVEGDDPRSVHLRYRSVLDEVFDRLDEIREHARLHIGARNARPPLIVLSTPKGWTGPVTVDELPVEGTVRAHEVPLPGVRDNAEHLALLEDWLRSYRPQELFEPDGTPARQIRQLHPEGDFRMSAAPVAHGRTQRDLRLPAVREHAVRVPAPGGTAERGSRALGEYLRDALVANPYELLYFSPDEQPSERLEAILEVTGRRWRAGTRDSEDRLETNGRVFDVLSQQLCQGWLEGYLRTGRHGVLSTSEAFAHVVDSMVVQHAKWLHQAAQFPWREPIPSLNYLLTPHVWQQDRNGPAHQDPGFIDHVLSKRPEVCRVYLPPDTNCLLHVVQHCLRSRGRVNVVVGGGDRSALQYLDADQAGRHCAEGLGVWSWASSDLHGSPEVVLACAGDVPTRETLAAAALLRELTPALAVRVVNVVDPTRLFPPDRHPHGISDTAYTEIFPPRRPVIFAYHGYPWLIHQLTYRRPGHDDLHVFGFHDNGATTTPFQMCAMNGIDRYHLALAALEQVPRVADRIGHLREQLLEWSSRAYDYARRFGTDPPEIRDWQWPCGASDAMAPTS
ncbi:phosphoketolase family protein [Nocardia sp. CA2R105]|uniref:phosphoketolase n=1 Tax=Nocardia coffeae TaxID=2873381 RepID=UPI001CA79E0B|nr:phosphoketolase family protein [Nocardia coffeae]MBY8861066.1 phosphoketolase family protein [Nocardia coffeae]